MCLFAIYLRFSSGVTCCAKYAYEPLLEPFLSSDGRETNRYTEIDKDREREAKDTYRKQKLNTSFDIVDTFGHGCGDR